MLPKTARWKVRRYRDGDEDALRRAINHRSVVRGTLNIPHPYTAQHAKDWIEKCCQNYKKQLTPDLGFAIEIEGSVAGGIGFHHIEGHKAELGYWLTPQHWGQGIMTEVARAMTRWGMRELGLVRIWANVFPFNKGSSRVLEKAGYVYEGRLHKSVKKNGRYYDDLLYAYVR